MNPAALRSPCRVRLWSRSEPMTETNTLACCRSAETSARVTVVNLIRGSFNSNRMASLATSRMASATRARRWCFISQPRAGSEHRAQHLGLGRDELGDRVGPQGVADLFERPLDRGHLVRHGGDPKDDHLVIVLGLDFGRGYVEPVSQPLDDAADHLALVLQALRLAQEQSYA